MIFQKKGIKDDTNKFLIVDSEIDINTAKNAGVKSVGVEWGFRGKGELEAAGANYIVNKPEQILEIL